MIPPVVQPFRGALLRRMGCEILNLKLTQAAQIVFECQVRHFATFEFNAYFLGQETQPFQKPGIRAALAQFLTQMTDALHERTVFETSNRFGLTKSAAMRAMQNINYVCELHRPQHCQRHGTGFVLVSGVEFLDEVYLHPCSSCESYFKNDRFARERVHRTARYVSQTGSSGVGVCFGGFCREKAVVAATGLYGAGFIDFPAAVAIGPMVEIYLLVGVIEI